MTTVTAHHRDTLIERAGDAASVRDVFAAASERLPELIQFDASVWLATDPATSLPTAPTRSENMSFVGGSDGCLRLWELEFLAEDVTLYRDVARAPVPAAGLREATTNRPARSPRYREFMRPNGLEDELRAALRVDGDTWAWLSLYREQGRPAFDREEIELVASLSDPLGEVVRDHARAEAAHAATIDRGPGLMLFAATGELVSMNDDAGAWLEEFPPDVGKAGPTDPVGAAGPFDVRFPMVVAAALMRARAIAEERDHGTARARLRSAKTGRWLVCHASCLREPDGALGNTALAIEPALAAEIAPIIVQAYELSPRERAVTQLIATGLSTGEIAARLFLSPHTVRDHVKAIFEKVGVSSRGELVAKLFADHYSSIHTEPETQVRVGF
jgi:DNA-binding CsgD family transcriptional regulator